jgi:hypothetical protein
MKKTDNALFTRRGEHVRLKFKDVVRPNLLLMYSTVKAAYAMTIALTVT